MPKPLAEQIDPGWYEALAPVESNIAAMGAFIRGEQDRGRLYAPDGADILNAFTRPFDDVKVLIVGQDPYPTLGHAMGLAFSVRPEVNPIPRSLENIFRELTADVLVDRPINGDLSVWADRGVMLLNRVLTVEPGNPGSHRGKGWEAITEQAIRALAARGKPLVALLWGRDAATAEPMLGETPLVKSPHPSPLSASRGFFGSRPFSTANKFLVDQGAQEVDWSLPS